MPKYELLGADLGHRGFSIAGAAGTACASASLCFAVGTGTTLHGRRALTTNTGLIWLYNGRVWRLSTRVPIAQSSLAAISCVSRSFCLAVGRAGNPRSRALALRWNGRSWSQVRAGSPASSGNGDALGSVDCLSRADCFAVGAINLGEGGAGIRHDLLEHWGGARFTVLRAPSSGIDLSTIACANAHDCWAGVSPSGAQPSTNEIARFNGRTFHVARLPESLNGGVSGISCSAAESCWLVGARTANGEVPVAMRLSGVAWKLTTMPSPRYPDVTLQGVGCASASDCWAVGTDTLVGPGITPPFKSAVFAELWDGSEWQIAKVAAARSGFLATASCAPSGLCVAGGQSAGGGALLAVAQPLP